MSCLLRLRLIRSREGSAAGVAGLGLLLGIFAWMVRGRRGTALTWACAAFCLVGGGLAVVLFGFGAFSTPTTTYVAGAAGLAAAFMALLFADVMLSDAKRSNFDVRLAVSRRAQVYQTIPATGTGVGRVRVHVAGRSVLLSAASAGPELARYSFCTIRDAHADGRVTVEPVAL